MSKFDKAVKELGPDYVSELEALDDTALKQRIVTASEAMRQVEEELDANVEYQQLRESVKAATAGKRDVDKRQKAVITVSLELLKAKGAA